ncbi:hypothetical protein ILUMI_16065 [Ignelater luminosus]|uniref:Uncharacterized protein n=1 Tax=Ignelater luminosus TaxID=2038154 RepID=A0A8K0CMF8_IGNLU|nr:hypothetical protein ILUMI_16065 [Ignelater luminosus]
MPRKARNPINLIDYKLRMYLLDDYDDPEYRILNTTKIGEDSDCELEAIDGVDVVEMIAELENIVQVTHKVDESVGKHEVVDAEGLNDDSQFYIKSKILAELTKKSYVRPVFPAIMSRERIQMISAFLQFDDYETRAMRKQLNKLVPISKLFKPFVKSYMKSSNPNPQLTVDE